jgi:hypothetical protein
MRQAIQPKICACRQSSGLVGGCRHSLAPTVSFIKTHLKNQSDAVSGGAEYRLRLSQYMSTEPAFNEAIERLRGAQAGAEAEAIAAGMESATN